MAPKWHLEKDPEVEQEREFLILSCMHLGRTLSVQGAKTSNCVCSQFPQAADLGNDHLAYGIAILDHEREDTTRCWHRAPFTKFCESLGCVTVNNEDQACYACHVLIMAH